MLKNERVLLAAPVATAALREADRVIAEGGEAVVVTSVAAAKEAAGSFDRGVFAFELPDGSGIVLAAEMMLETRVQQVRFVDPRDPLRGELLD